LGLHEKNTLALLDRELPAATAYLSGGGELKTVFTGLIQALGTIRPLGGDRFNVSCRPDALDLILQDLAVGDSVAVDGICLTVENILPQGFVATASDETLRRTTLGQPHRSAAYVNLETSVRVGSKLGGHFVTGHIDGIGCLQESVQTPNSWEMCFTAPVSLRDLWQRQITRYLVPKGSIAVNGVSLTIADCDPQGSWFKVAVIPHTYAQTNLSHLQIGSWVNLESDILGKYVEKLLGHHVPASDHPDEISPAFLAENGYL
jgi:riboflavin synthase